MLWIVLALACAGIAIGIAVGGFWRLPILGVLLGAVFFWGQTALEEAVEREMIWLHAWNVGSGGVGLLPKER